MASEEARGLFWLLTFGLAAHFCCCFKGIEVQTHKQGSEKGIGRTLAAFRTLPASLRELGNRWERLFQEAMCVLGGAGEGS